MFIKFLLFAVLSLIFNTVACSQSKLIDITNEKDLLIDIEFVGKPGNTKKYLIQTADKSIKPQTPNAYQVFEKKYYKIETDVIAYGDPMVTFNVSTNQEDFSKVRILRLTSSELNPNGTEWEDCTVTSERLGNSAGENYSVKKIERLKRFLPDFLNKKVSCELRDTMKQEEFFVVTTQLQPPPTKPFTKITWNLEDKTVSSKANVIAYKMTFTNAGTTDISEFNFRSIFDTDTKLNSIKPSQGTCRPSTFGTSFGSAVCYVGRIPVGKSITLELEGTDSGMSGNPPEVLVKKNQGWVIWGYLKESANDAVWDANQISIEPLAKGIYK